MGKELTYLEENEDELSLKYFYFLFSLLDDEKYAQIRKQTPFLFRDIERLENHSRPQGGGFRQLLYFLRNKNVFEPAIAGIESSRIVFFRLNIKNLVKVIENQKIFKIIYNYVMVA